jgi:hypothetical protein
LSAAAGLLQGAHAVIAMRRGPHWLLNDQDAKAYGLALANALRHLPVTMAQKYVDFCALGIAVFAYEGPRVALDMQLRAQRGAAARPRPPSGPAQVFQFRAAAGPQPEQPPPQSPTVDMTYEPDTAN